MKELNNKKGISLIVLVITIIVMIVLATAIILSLQDSGIIDKANEARAKTDIANAKQVVGMARAEWEFMTRQEQNNKGSFKAYAEEKLKAAGYKDDVLSNILITNNGSIEVLPEIPTGFTASIYNGEQNIDTGLVIYKTDAETLATKKPSEAQIEYDQFVWIPVDDMSKLERTLWSNNAPTSGLSPYLTEPSSIGYANEAKEEKEMRESVEKYGGFYVARYEAGDGTATAARTAATDAKKVVIRKDAYLYNYVSWGTSMSDIGTTGAVYLAQTLYPANDNYTTHLMYSAQWDYILRWLSDKYNVTDGKTWGNFKNSEEDAAINCGNSEMNFISGRNEAWKAKNIYDLAGNLREWVMEAGYDDEDNSNFRILRGGVFMNDQSSYNSPNGREGALASRAERWYGFRPVLYLK